MMGMFLMSALKFLLHSFSYIYIFGDVRVMQLSWNHDLKNNQIIEK